MATGTLTKALTAALNAAETRPQDAAAIALARKYAAQVDADPDMLWRIGPRLLEVLVELGMTPKARAGVMRGGQADDGTAGSKLDELRARRQRHTQVVDSRAP